MNLASNTYFPQKTYVTFETANPVQIISECSSSFVVNSVFVLFSFLQLLFFWYRFLNPICKHKLKELIMIWMDRDTFYFDFTDKLKEFNEKVENGNQLSAAELNSLQTLMEGKDATDVHLNVINKVLSWPPGNVCFSLYGRY